MTSRFFFVASLLLFSACSQDDESDRKRGPLGKEDSAGSCQGSDCNGPAPVGNCWCDADCAQFGDCCADKVAVCGGTQACGGIVGLTCGQDQYCQYDDAGQCGAADQLGTCQPVPQACTFQIDPVCGCNGVTYDNECFAAMAGTSVAHAGSCGSTATSCGGHLGLACDTNEYCMWPVEQMCGAADHLGTCKPTPDVCPQVFDEVCGCNGQTYSNECFAAMSGVSIVKKGACN